MTKRVVNVIDKLNIVDEILKKTTYSKEMQNAIIKKLDGNLLFINEINEIPVAFIIVSTLLEGSLLIEYIHVDHEHTRKQIGKTLIEKTIDYAKANGYNFLSVLISKQQTAAKKYFIKQNFKSLIFISDDILMTRSIIC